MVQVQISSRQTVSVARRTAVQVAPAPDGLPLLLMVDRGEAATDLMFGAAARLGYGRPEDFEREPFGERVRWLDKLLDERDLQEVRTDDGPVKCFLTRQPVTRYAGPTLLQRLLATAEQAEADDGGRREDTRVGAHIAGTADERPLVRGQVGQLRLLLPLDDGPALVARRVHRPNRSYELLPARPFLPESLAALQSARYYGEERSGGQWPPVQGSLRPTKDYLRGRRDAVWRGAPGDWFCWVAQRDLCQIIGSVARSVFAMHQRGELHGDLKPSNVLLREQGPTCIDSLRLREGELSPAMTPGWAAPEQILGRPVSPATDQFPIGTMICRLLGAVSFGEEITMVVPTGGSQLERFVTLKNPGVYLDPEVAQIPAKGVVAWQQLLARCLAFDADKRFPSMEALVAELAEVSERFPLEGERVMPLLFGTLVITDSEPTPPEIGWLTYDTTGGVVD